MSAVHTAGEPLLLVVSPAARAVDGESVRVARDVLAAGAPVKLAFPKSAADLDRVLAHRGRRRPVVIGDDRALHQVLRALHRQRSLNEDPIGVVPVGRGETVALAKGLGVPGRAVDAARAVLLGGPRGLDLLVDESGDVVLGGIRIPGHGGSRWAPAAGPLPDRGRTGSGLPSGGGPAAADRTRPAEGCSLKANSSASTERDGGDAPGLRSALGRTVRSVARTVTAPLRPLTLPGASCPRLRVEADGRVLADLDLPLRLVSVWNVPTWAQRGIAPDDGYAELLIRAAGPLRARARQITVTGADFHYTVDGCLMGPVRSRTWTVVPRAWHLLAPGR